MIVPLLDLKSQYQSIKEEVLKVVEEIFESQYFILGPHVENGARISQYQGAEPEVGIRLKRDVVEE